MRPACNACADFTNIYADISFGGLGSPDNFTTVITRTKKGKEIFNKVVKTGVIKILDKFNEKGIKDKLVQLSQSKIKRAESYFGNKLIKGKISEVTSVIKEE